MLTILQNVENFPMFYDGFVFFVIVTIVGGISAIWYICKD